MVFSMKRGRNSLPSSLVEYSDNSDHSDHSTKEDADQVESSYRQKKGSKWRKRILHIRTIILATCVILGTVCGTTVYICSSRAEQDRFEQRFARHSMEIEKSSDRNFDNILSVISYTGLSISSYAMDRNQTWPFVTIPSFVKKAESMLNLTGAFNVSMNVLVEENEKDAWEEYSVANQGWIQTGLELNEEGQVAPPIIPYIHKGNATLPAKGPADPYYSVRWQISPVPENIDWVNFNPLTNEMASTFDELMKMYPATLSALRDEPHDNEGRLQSHLIHPLFKQIYPSEVQSQRTLVGYLDTVVPLDIFFKNILPPGAAPLALVLHNSCGQTATFELRGPSVFLLSSTEDIHDKKFNHMEMLFIFSNQTLDRYGGISENMYSTAQSMDGIYCFYEYSIYPTQELQDIYMTYRPLYFTLGFVFTFLFAIILIFVYDFFRAKQKKSVKTKAERDNAILTSLFPVQVRQRLIDANDRSSNKKDMLKKEVRDDNQSDELSMSSKGTQKDERRIGDRSGRIDKFRSRLKRGNTRKSLNLSSTDFDPFDDDEEDEDAKVAKLLLSKPIADLFPRATVLFADICGFTSWSSKREPSDVFLLLETLYGEFDKAAKREGIFKVETIGDCYVAVTGLPEPRKDHAEATSRFALKCITKSKIIFNELIPKLGPDTANLNMRFGLHSGPVTAGVLRGEKSRFQLFGDTVNTASRIETTGRRDSVHLSESTAKLLIESGKESWIEQREDKVSAKGKGQLTTYWLVVKEKADVLKQLVEVKERVTDRRKKRYPNVFVGHEAVDALLYNGLAKSRQDAVQLGRLMAKDLALFKNETALHTFGDDLNFYRFIGYPNVGKKPFVRVSVWENEGDDKVVEISDVLKPISTLAKSAEAFSECIDIRDRKYHLKSYKSCFIGAEAVDALLYSSIVSSREEAVEFGRCLADELRWFHSVTGEHEFKDDDNIFYRLRVPRNAEDNLDDSISSMVSEFLYSNRAVNDPMNPHGKIDLFMKCVQPLVKHRKGHMTMKVYKSVFCGEEAVDALVYAGFARTRREAVYHGRFFAKRLGLFYHVLHERGFSDGYFFYRFRAQAVEGSMHSIFDDTVFNPEREGVLSVTSADPTSTSNPAVRGELGEKADMFRKYIDVRDRCIVRIGKHRITYKTCFIGSEAVDALVFSEVTSSREEAVELGRTLAKELRLFSVVTGSDLFKDDDQYYRFREDNGPSQGGQNTEIDYLARQELVEKAEAFKKCCHVKDRYYHFRKYKQCFVGKETVDAVVKAGVVETRMEAVELARTLARELRVLRHVCGDHAFCDDYLFFKLDDKEIREEKLREYLGDSGQNGENNFGTVKIRDDFGTETIREDEEDEDAENSDLDNLKAPAPDGDQSSRGYMHASRYSETFWLANDERGK